MPRGRMLDKEAISQSRKLSELSSDTGRLIYTWLLAHLDSEGRFSADPAIIKGIVFPRIKNMTISKIEKSLSEMADIGLIIKYNADGDIYLQYIKFREYQNLDKNREAASKLPPPDENKLNSGTTPINSELVFTREDKLREDKLREDKDNSPKNPKVFSDDSDEIMLSKLLFAKIKERDEKCKEPDFQKWAAHIDKLIRLDKRSQETIKKVIEWCQFDNFWQNNILSTEKLRTQFTQLILKMDKKGGKDENNSGGNKRFKNERDYSDEEQELINARFYA